MTGVQTCALPISSGHVLGWYVEDGTAPGQPGDGGVLAFSSGRTRQDAIMTLPGMRTRFGFYLEASESSEASEDDEDGHGNDEHGNGDHPRGPWKRYFTNRKLNDCGPEGQGAVHTPFDGDVQALVFDVSRWAGADTWLVCFEDRDSGAMPDREVIGADSDDDDEEHEGDDRRRCRVSDNDYDDVIIEVGAEGATPARSLTFGALKLLYR